MNTLSFALRYLARSPAFTVVAVLTLALGIGFSVSSFSVANAFLLRDVPYPDAARLVRIFRTAPQSNALPHAPANLLDIRQAATSFDGMAIYNIDSSALGEPGQPAEQVWTVGATAEVFEVLRLQPTLGRGFVAGDDQPGRPLVTVLSDRAWQRRYGADPRVLGRTVRLNSVEYTVVGVLPPDFDAPLVWGQAEFVIPITLAGDNRSSRTLRWMQCVARLKPGVALAQAQSELSTIAMRLVKSFPKENGEMGLRVAPLHDSNVTGPIRLLPWLMTALALTMLVIACANLAALQLARAFGRAHDFAVRAALGGTRWQLMFPVVVESLLLAAAGGIGGILVASWSNELMGRYLFVATQRGADLPIDYRVLGFAAAIALAAGLGFGLLPAWLAARTSATSALNDVTRSATPNRTQQRLKHTLIAATLGLALTLVGVATSFGFGFRDFLRRPVGWDPHGLYAGNLVLPANRYSDPAKLLEFQRSLLDGLRALPGVERAALTPAVPLYALEVMGRTTGLIVDGQPPPTPGQETAAEATGVTSDYFETMRIPLRQGRAFAPTLKPTDPLAMVVSQAAAERLWPGQDPIGRRVRFAASNSVISSKEWFEVVGVVGDVRMLTRLDAPPTRLQVYWSQAQRPSRYLTIVLQSAQPPETLVAAVGRTVAALDADLAVSFAGSLTERAEFFTGNTHLIIVNLAVSAGLGLLIAAVGLYGVISQLIAQRTREIGVRIALGATPRDVLALVFGQGSHIVAAGVAVGVPGFYALSLLLRRTMPELTMPGVWLLAANLLVLLAVALIACWAPAHRASHVDPVEALRAE